MTFFLKISQFFRQKPQDVPKSHNKPPFLNSTLPAQSWQNPNFSQKMYTSSAKISYGFYLTISYSPYFRKNDTLLPISENFLFSTIFLNSPPLIFQKLPVFGLLYVVFASPYFDHDALMHPAMRVL